MAEGMWSPILKSWRRFGLDFDELPPSKVASDFGPVLPDGEDLLPALIRYREIIESNRSILEKSQAMEALRASMRGTRWPHLGSDAASFLKSHLVEVLGVSSGIATKLFDAGLKTPEEVRVATDYALSGIPGIGAKTIEKIRASIGY